ncbi:DUF2946 family protein [uncultured Pseudacidovorax sp.]|uniref:DUF2946 family protein n=1 Tax=uncultured Pseudacidovorax sp. TaxID=679313 RepID=UPI0025FB9718|nr:DUF2946 family protein [uncultured Pseudacidovorax sp.]
MRLLAVLRLLLIAVLFNTAVGHGLHEGVHLREGGAALSSAADLGDADEPGEARTDAVCAWCHLGAQLASAIWPPPAILGVAVVGTAQPLLRIHPPRPAPNAWRYSARDPPVRG